MTASSQHGVTPGTAGCADRDEIASARAALRAARQPRHAKLRKAVEFLDENEVEEAEHLIKHFLEKHPGDASALNLLAEAVLKRGRKDEAAEVLKRCVECAPDFAAGRFNYANALYELNKLPAALTQIDTLLAPDPHNVLYLDFKAVVLATMGRHQESMLCRKQLTEEHPHSPDIWLKFGSSLRSIGEREGCIGAFRKAIALRPSCGSPWWGLADLKTFRFSDSDIDEMQSHLANPEMSRDDRIYLHFALGKAYGDIREFAKSFENYARGNALKRLEIEYDPDSLKRHVAQSKALFTQEFLANRAGEGCNSSEPIFIVGLQRAGSTLVEQVLASHPAIQGTAELPDLPLLAEHVGERIAPDYGSNYPGVLAKLDTATRAALGVRYLETTQFRRTEASPHFTDKMPYNFLHIGLIHLILPNAKIVDVRRHPLDCCLSNFTSYFESGALFACRLNELGHAYADYVDLMAHFDAVLPGRVHRVIYEDLVRSPDREIRRLLDHIGLPFDEACLRFHENPRAMVSASSEQVRRPINNEALARWRDYEPWLGPLKAALGPVLDAYPAVPAGLN